jgi:hypothetical protein
MNGNSAGNPAEDAAAPSPTPTPTSAQWPPNLTSTTGMTGATGATGTTGTTGTTGAEPPTAPVTPGYYTAATNPSPARNNRRLLIGAGAVVAAAAVIGIIIGVSGGGSSGSSTGSGSSSGAAPHTAKVYSHLPADGCGLVTAATVSTYAAGAKCTPSPLDKDQLNVPGVPPSITRGATWETDLGTQPSVHVDVELTLDANSPNLYKFDLSDMKGSSADQGFPFSDSRPVSGLGDQAYITYGQSTVDGVTELMVQRDNTLLDIRFTGGQSQQTDEAAATAMAGDVYKAIS